MKKLIIPSLLALAAMHSSACDLNVPDLNNPSLSELETNPTRALVNSAATGLIVGHRTAVAPANGYIVQLGILGREAYNFDGADPRFIGELLAGTLQKSSPFGGAFWNPPYANIRLANIIIAAADKVVDFSDAEKSAVKGFAHTMMALDLLRVIVTRDTNGAIIDTNKSFDPEVEIGPFVDKAATFARINELLDTAKTELLAGGAAFPFPLTSGFTGFGTSTTSGPADFLKVNRAYRARAALYQGDSAGVLTALGESFINATATTTAALNAGPTLVYSANTGDAVSGLAATPIFAHPKLKTEAQLNGTVIDDRFTRKIRTVPDDEAGANQGLSSNLKYTIYTRTGPVPLIRNEELILMRAEAELALGMKTQAVADLNIVRTVSGKLPALVDPTITDAQVTAEIIYNRRYSLMFEGHRWIDIRRFNLPTDQFLDKPDHKFNLRYPIPQGECDARPADEPACAKGSL